MPIIFIVIHIISFTTVKYISHNLNINCIKIRRKFSSWNPNPETCHLASTTYVHKQNFIICLWKLKFQSIHTIKKNTSMPVTMLATD